MEEVEGGQIRSRRELEIGVSTGDKCESSGGWTGLCIRERRSDRGRVLRKIKVNSLYFTMSLSFPLKGEWRRGFGESKGGVSVGGKD